MTTLEGVLYYLKRAREGRIGLEGRRGGRRSRDTAPFRASADRPSLSDGSLERRANNVVVKAKPRRTEGCNGLRGRRNQARAFGSEDGTESANHRDAESAGTTPGGSVVEHGGTFLNFQRQGQNTGLATAKTPLEDGRRHFSGRNSLAPTTLQSFTRWVGERGCQKLSGDGLRNQNLCRELVEEM